MKQKRDFYLPRKNRDKLLEELEWETKELAFFTKEKDQAGIDEANRMIGRINERLNKNQPTKTKIQCQNQQKTPIT